MPMKTNPSTPAPDPASGRARSRLVHFAFKALITVVISGGWVAAACLAFTGRWPMALFYATMYMFLTLSFIRIPFIDPDSDFMAIQRGVKVDERQREIALRSDRFTSAMVLAVGSGAFVGLMTANKTPSIWFGVAYFSYFAVKLGAQLFYSRRM